MCGLFSVGFYPESGLWWWLINESLSGWGINGWNTEGIQNRGRGSCVFFAIFKHHKGPCDTPEEKTKRQKDKEIGRKLMRRSGVSMDEGRVELVGTSSHLLRVLQ